MIWIDFLHQVILNINYYPDSFLLLFALYRPCRLLVKDSALRIYEILPNTALLWKVMAVVEAWILCPVGESGFNIRAADHKVL
jgi:hypothetical protein